jgi:asparagine synthase (glutamine-hydrolysing)
VAELPGSPSEVFEALDARFEAAVDRTLEGREAVTLLYSGGVDSTLVALALRSRVRFDALVVGVANGPDPVRARAAADRIGLALREVRLDEADLRRALSEEGGALARLREPARSVQVALGLAVASSGTPRVLTGQGADELFGGYAHFRGLGAEELQARRSQDLARLLDVDWPLSRGVATRSGHDLRSPFLEEGFVRHALDLPLEPVGPTALTKPLLRRWAVHRGVPQGIAAEPKHAMQYGSGVAGAIRRLDSSDRGRTAE